MAESTSQVRARLNGALFGGLLGFAVALVQVVLFMTGTSTYDVSQVTAAAVTTSTTSDLTGFVLIPLLIIASFAAAGAALAVRWARPAKASTSPYA